MKNRPALRPALLLSACFVFNAFGAGAAPAADPAPPSLRLPKTARPLMVHLDLTLRPDQETFEGKAGIELELLEPASFLWLNGTNLEVSSATLTAAGKTTPARAVAGGEEFLGFDFGREVAAGKARLDIAYRGRVDPIETEGVFRQKVGEDWYLFTQFESTFARRAFPGFDEPEFRNPWKLTLRVPREMLALANYPQVSERTEANGLKTVEFATTQPFSSYLVAFAVGPFGVVEAGTWGRSKTPFRVIVPRGEEAKTKYAAEVTGPLLAALEEYFGVPHPFPKLDNLSIPQTVQFGAMENPGLITYVDRYLLADPARQTVERQQAYAEVAAHENAHQWFGNLVTMRWWDDIWLNEGFATWMAQKIVSEWKPEWNLDDEIATRRAEAMGSDSLASSQPVRRPIRNEGDIVSAFDGISYQKGGALLSMYESWMGREKFRQGIRGYIQKHSWSNATSDDFLTALAVEGGAEVKQSFASFLDQPGVPVVAANLECANGRGKLRLEQRRYVPLGSPASRDSRWDVPVQVTYGSGDRAASTRVMLNEPAETAALDFCPEWIQTNEGGMGYFITELSPPLYEAMVARAGDLPVREQIAFLDDVKFLFGSGDLEPQAALSVVSRFAESPNRKVMDSVVKLALSVEDNFFDEKMRGNYERFLRSTFGARARKLGFMPKPGEPLDDTLLRSDVIKAVADQGADPELRAEARRLTEAWLVDPKAVSPESLGTVLRVAARDGDAAFFDRLVVAAQKAPDSRVRRQVLSALGAFRDPAAVEKALALVLSPTFDIRETAFSVLFNLSGDRVTRDRLYEWIRTSYDPLAAALPEQYSAALVYATAGQCDEAKKEEIRAFFTPRYEKVTGGMNNLDKVMDIVGICIGRKARQGAGVEKFLASY